MSEFGTILTRSGIAMLANAKTAQKMVGLSHIAIGDGAGAPNQNQTALKSEIYRSGINRSAISASDNSLVELDARIPPETGGFTIREAGVFAANGQLFAVCQYPETYKPALAEGSGLDLLLRLNIRTANAANITLKIDPNIIHASRQWVNETVLPLYLQAALNTVEIDRIKNPY